MEASGCPTYVPNHDRSRCYGGCAARIHIGRKCVLGLPTGPGRNFSQRGFVSDPVQPVLGRLCDFLVSQYLIWGRFLYTAWLKQRTYYAVTDRRVIAVQNNWGRRVASSYIDTLPMIAREGSANGCGVLRFAPAIPMWSRQGGGWGAWNNMRIGETPTFMDVEDVNSVYQLVSDLREKARMVKT